MPTHLKLARGNPGKRPIEKASPQPGWEKPECPHWLTADAKAEWERIFEELFKIGLLAQIDRAALAAYCQLYGRWIEAEKIIKREGLIMVTGFGNQIQHPAVGISNKTMEMMHKFLTEFGMTPSSRSRLSVVPPEQGSLLDQFLKD